ncbi:uncharacterized protein TRIVIDRAFT_191864 [Trichoderma virens Gv29-8]|uniref:Zn(2)-C6 fungal-type domain-containing protein n=1 Tax=Hypocrea virens (strain Gv29-8 / FGSC 10586) TaxID=413071 RepID=G9MUK4_HYPVG|nr:uncharacterized protein TRIVIDRAFT_191864 [Trichoderma virens Gv29-8]EHK21883.1 hypothetical protein TRIVIDRAFT_191864 [Trichoderma virens Gv29-8]
MDREEIERILHRKRKPQEKACYPCHRRKVRCNHCQPCSTCERRGHPEICSYSFGRPAATKRRDKQPRLDVDNPLQAIPVTGSAISRQNSPQEAVGSGTDERHLSSSNLLHPSDDAIDGQSNAGNPFNFADDIRPSNEVITPADHTYEGDNSIVAVLRQHAIDLPSSSRIRDARMFFGLQNSFSSDPLFTVPTLQQRWESLLSFLPQNQEFHRFFPSYRYTAYPFMPFLVDIGRFELRVCKYLESWAAGELQDKLHPSYPWISDEGVTFVALLLATLSCGSHFSTLHVTQRCEISRDFVRRAFKALQLANYMLRPSLDAVQTLLILGNTLQNIGQSDGAWVLLGTTVRLAQALGLHTENGVHDCFLSVCHGRPASVSNVQVQTLWRSNTFSSTLSYIEVMRSVAFICFEVTESTPDMERSVRLVQKIDDCSSRSQPYLKNRDSCGNLQELLEHLALQINTSFAICFLCRPAIKKPTSTFDSEAHQFLIVRAKKGLQNILKAFLDFQALSIVPLRNWSMIHSALTSTLLLSIWEETRGDSRARDLREGVLNVLLETSQRDTDLNANIEQHCHRTHWLSTRHVRTLKNLLETICNIPLRSSTRLRKIPGKVTDTANSALDEDYQFPWISTDLSPIAYVDEIMNGEHRE